MATVDDTCKVRDWRIIMHPHGLLAFYFWMLHKCLRVPWLNKVMKMTPTRVCLASSALAVIMFVIAGRTATHNTGDRCSGGHMGATGRVLTGLPLKHDVNIRALVRSVDDRAANLRAAGAEV